MWIRSQFQIIYWVHISCPAHRPFFQLGYSCFTMLCEFLLHNGVSQLYVCTYVPPFCSLPPPPPHPCRSPESTGMSSLHCTVGPHELSVYTWLCTDVNLHLPVHPTPLLPAQGPYIHSLHLISTPALQIGTSVPFS